MSRVDAAAADRLPWLPDEPSPAPRRQRGGRILPWAAAAVLMVAASGFWLGFRSVNPEAPPVARHPQASTTVRLPAPRAAEPPQVGIPVQPELRPVRTPEVRPAPVRELHIASPRSAKSPSEEASNAAASEQPKSETEAQSPPVASAVVPKPWNPRVFEGAAGRVVQIGAFGSTPQAKRGWWFMVRAYPAVAHLPAVVRPTRNSKGRTFYRFQVGTTSQAHSEILCQRMNRIGLSCAVVGLPWKPKVER